MKHYRFLFALLLVNHCIDAKLNQEKATEYDAWLSTFGEVINIFEGRYYGDVRPAEAMADAIKSYAQRDPHTAFLDRKSCKELQEKMSGEFFGIGIVLPGDKKTEEEFFPIIETVPGGPAEKAGLKTGDKIIQINQETVKGLDIDEIMSRLKGEKNTKVVLKALRPQYPEPLSFEIIRDVVKDEMALSYYLPEQKIYYLLLAIFSEKSAEQVQKIIQKAIQEKSNGVILDLRNNTGGLFDSAIEIAGLFLPHGTPVVSIKEQSGKTVGEWKTKRKPLNIPRDMPIFILVNNYTASASEILAGVLQLYATKKDMLSTFIIGDSTFGKGSVQEVIPVSNESALKLTTGLYFLPFNTSIQGKGVIPDFIIEHRSPPSETVKWLTSAYGKETSLRGTIAPQESKSKKNEAHLKQSDKNAPTEEKSWKDRRREVVAHDYLIQNTLNLIGLFNIAKKALPMELSSHKKAVEFMKHYYTIDTDLKPEEISLGK